MMLIRDTEISVFRNPSEECSCDFCEEDGLDFLYIRHGRQDGDANPDYFQIGLDGVYFDWSVFNEGVSWMVELSRSTKLVHFGLHIKGFTVFTLIGDFPRVDWLETLNKRWI